MRPAWPGNAHDTDDPRTTDASDEALAEERLDAACVAGERTRHG